MSVDKAISNIPDPMDDQVQQQSDANVDAQRMQQGPPDASNLPMSQPGPNLNVQPRTLIAAPKPSPNDLHQSIFRNVLETLSGGPVKRINPDTGAVEVVHNKSVKSLGAGILAGAISSMMAGMATPTTIDKFGHRDLSGAAKAGAEAGAANTPQARSDADQQRKDAALGRQYQIMHHNLEQHAAVLNNMKLQGEVMDKAVAEAKPVIDGMALAQQSGSQVINKQGVTEAELQKMMADGSAHVTRDQVMVDGKTDVYGDDGKPVMNPDGTPKQAYTYTIYNPSAMIKMTDEIREANPELVNVGNSTPVPVAVLAKYATQRNQMSNAQGFIDDWVKKSEAKPIDFRAAIKKDPYMQQLVPVLGRYAGLDPDQVLNKMESDKVDPQLIGRFQKLFGVDRDAMAKQRAAEERKQKAAEALEQNKAESAVTLQREKDLALFKKQQGITEGPVSTKPYANDWADANGNHWDMTAPATQMVDGNIDPTQLSKKSKDYDAKLREANAYSFARYGKPFDLAQAQSDYKFATNVGTQNTIRLLQSLTGEGGKNTGGTLDILQNQLKALGNTRVPKFNELANWASKNAGLPGVTNFQTTLLNVADEWGKILGGGVATDASRQEAYKNIDAAFSGAQGVGAVNAIRGGMAQRQNALVGNNRYLMKQFGKMESPGQPGQAAPQQQSQQLTNFHVGPGGQQIGQNPQGQWFDVATGKPYIPSAVPAAQ